MTTSRSDKVLLGAAAVLAFGYLMTGFGLPIGYPAIVGLKSSGILLLAVYALRSRSILLGLALVASAIGDAMLALQPAQMTLGMAAFGIAHILYGWLFFQIIRSDGFRGPLGVVLACVLGAFGGAMLVTLLPGMGELTVPASIYNVIIMLMAILAAVSKARWLAVAGAILFVASDSLIAMDLFMGQNPAWRGPTVWVTYVAAQFCLAIGLLRRA
ncbi:lysoplasmalogenase [Hyphobacterium sp. HN65]|uniref:Lysoplasmalogenase n=1 Tax=Hyphobacterium lacteum TaxID=3116575 RepID=A0ABU7LQ09_9PROT|nr:lysoplasmalogenase [Hyphobacterium sp. HN65]MEE2525973.1 lysoplasmalogenase [Hyphobacterium sp. HN65]